MENKFREITKILKNEKYNKLSVNAKYLYLELMINIDDDNLKELTNKKVREILNISNKTACSVLKELEDNGLLILSKQNKNTNFVDIIDITKQQTTTKTVTLIKFNKNLYINKPEERNTLNYDWLKTRYERFGA